MRAAASIAVNAARTPLIQINNPLWHWVDNDSEQTDRQPVAAFASHNRQRTTAMAIQTEAARDKLVSDFRAVIGDTEELLRATANQTGERISATRERVEERLRTAREELAELQASATQHAKQAARATDDYVHEHPWQSVGVAAAVGFLLGMLTARR
jgi:ElaB/YqjD/DUF883 family membrane-anchored ribosome-binding protein